MVCGSRTSLVSQFATELQLSIGLAERAPKRARLRSTALVDRTSPPAPRLATPSRRRGLLRRKPAVWQRDDGAHGDVVGAAMASFELLQVGLRAAGRRQLPARARARRLRQLLLPPRIQAATMVRRVIGRQGGSRAPLHGGFSFAAWLLASGVWQPHSPQRQRTKKPTTIGREDAAEWSSLCLASSGSHRPGPGASAGNHATGYRHSDIQALRVP